MNKYSIAFENTGIRLSKTSGKEYAICPVCSHLRKPENRKKKCLLVNIDEGNYTCCHCGEYGSVKKVVNYKQTLLRTSAPKNYSRKIDTIPEKLFYQSLTGYENNNFALFVADRFGTEQANNIINSYHIGTSKHWGGAGATALWYLDSKFRIRSGKVMLFDHTSKRCNRVKTPFDHITWTHSILELKGLNLSLPFFGEHLLTERPLDTVAVVESEKTACIASIFFPKLIWVASSGLTGLTEEKTKVLKERNVILVCDAGLGEYKWTKKIEMIAKIASNVVLNTDIQALMNKEQIEEGNDLADLLLDQDAFNASSSFDLNFSG